MSFTKIWASRKCGLKTEKGDDKIIWDVVLKIANISKIFQTRAGAATTRALTRPTAHNPNTSGYPGTDTQSRCRRQARCHDSVLGDPDTIETETHYDSERQRLRRQPLRLSEFRVKIHQMVSDQLLRCSLFLERHLIFLEHLKTLIFRRGEVDKSKSGPNPCPDYRRRRLNRPSKKISGSVSHPERGLRWGQSLNTRLCRLF